LQPRDGLGLEGEEAAAARLEGNRTAHELPPPDEVDPHELAARSLELRGHTDGAAALDARDKRFEPTGERVTTQRLRAVDQRGQPRPRLGCEVVAPASKLRQGRGRQPKHRDPAFTLEPADAAGQSQDRVDVDRAQIVEALEGGGVEHGDQPGQVLPHDVVAGNREGGRVALALGERRAVALCEEGETDADDQEGRREDGVAWIPRERERGEAQPTRSSPARALEQAERRPQHPRGQNGRRKGCEAREYERHVAPDVPDNTRNDEPQSGDSRDVNRRERDAAERRRAHSGRRSENSSGESRESQRDEESAGRDDALPQNGSHGCARLVGNRRADADAGHDPEDGSGGADGESLDSRQQRKLPRARAVPREPPPGREQVAPDRRRRQDREGEEQRGRLPADEPQTASGAPAGRLRVAKLFDRRDHVEGRRGRLEARADARDVRRQLVHLPQPRLPDRQR